MRRWRILALDDPRLLAWLRDVCIVYWAGIALWSVAWDVFGIHLGSITQDFPFFWIASKLTLGGAPQDAYDPQLYEHALSSVFSKLVTHLPWLYPPMAFLLYWPVALFPYYASWIGFAALTAGLLTYTVRKIVPLPITTWLVLSSPAVILCAKIGQNGMLNAALISLFFLALPARPVLAGVFLGLLSYKPHLLPVFYGMLLVGRQWKPLASGLTASVLLAALSALAFGAAPWEAWWQALHRPIVLGDNQLPYHAMTTAFSVGKVWGAGITTCWLLQAGFALPACWMTLRLWYARSTFDLKAAAAIFTALLLTPYGFYYDQPLALVGCAFWLRHCLQAGWQPKEYGLMALVWLLPMWSVFHYAAFVPLSPVVLLMAVVFLSRRPN